MSNVTLKYPCSEAGVRNLLESARDESLRFTADEAVSLLMEYCKRLNLPLVTIGTSEDELLLLRAHSHQYKAHRFRELARKEFGPVSQRKAMKEHLLEMAGEFEEMGRILLILN